MLVKDKKEFKDILFKITDPKDIKFFINNLNKVNNIMKKVSIDSDEFTEYSGNIKYKETLYNETNPNFVLQDFSFNSYLYKSECIPRTITIEDIVFNKKETELVESLNEKLDGCKLNMFIDNCLDLYAFIRDYKNLVTEIIVTEDYVYISSKAGYYPLVRVLDEFYVDNKVTVTDDINISITVDEQNQPDVFNDINSKKGTYEIYFNTSTNRIYVGVDDMKKRIKLSEKEEVCKLTMSPKYFTGNSGMKINKSSITFLINSIEESEDLLHYTIIFNVNGKMKVSNTYLAVLI